MDLCVGFAGVAIATIVICVLWRRNLAINHPEKYRRLREFEEEKAQKRKKTLGVVAKVGLFSLRWWLKS
jgi:hypothetical protein